MANLRAVPAYNLNGGAFPPPLRYTLKASETFDKGDIVVLDGNEDVLEVSADPAGVLGIAAEAAANVVEAGFVMVWPATGSAVFAMQGDNDPVEDDVNQEYGVVLTSGVWLVDGTETGTLVVYVVDVDLDRNLYFVLFLDATRDIKA